MYYFGKENFNIFLFYKFGIRGDDEQIKEEQKLVYKEELSIKKVSQKLLKLVTEIMLVETCTCIINKIEWIVCVASDADTSYPLFLYCLKDGIKVYEEVLKEE